MSRNQPQNPVEGRQRRLGLKIYTPEEQRSLEGCVVRLAISGKLKPASRRARTLQKKLGIPVTQKSGSRIIKVYPDGREEILAVVKKPKYSIPKNVTVIHKP